jgi:hypothetical protein
MPQLSGKVCTGSWGGVGAWIRAVSQLLWPDKGREVWSRPAGTTKRPIASRISCSAALAKVACAVPASRDRMQLGGATKLHRKSGSGLQQLRNSSSRLQQAGETAKERVNDT